MDRTSAASWSLPLRGAGPLVVGRGVLGHAAIRQLHRLPLLADAAVAIAGLTILPAALAGMVREGGPGGLDPRRVLGSTLRAPGRALTSWLLFAGAAGIAQTRPLASFPAGSTPLRGLT